MVKSQPGLHPAQHWGRFIQTGLAIVAVFALLCFSYLGQSNVALNEVGKLALSYQYVNPAWLPNDWYFNQPIGYQALFALLFGRLVAAWGFLATSIVGRLLCYALIASAFVFLGRRLGLVLPLLLLVTAVFLKKQYVVAGEWLVGGFEAKVLAYGCILWAIECLLRRSYRWMALLLGVATSFHVLVGGYATLTVLGWIALRWRTRLPPVREMLVSILLYLIGSAFAIQAILGQTAASSLPVSALQPSYIYVFLRNPHHLNPLSWNGLWLLGIYLFLLIASFAILHWQHRTARSLPDSSSALEIYTNQQGLFEFALISLIPFGLGLSIAPFDAQGHWLKYYPFRFGDLMLALSTYLLVACAIQFVLLERANLTSKVKKALLLTSLVLLSVIYVEKAYGFTKDLLVLREFPGYQQDVAPAWKELCHWVKQNTPPHAIVAVSPNNTFSWLAARATIASFKLVPNENAAILEWYQRLQDLSGKTVPWTYAGLSAGDRLANDYHQLQTAQVQALLTKYQADYFATASDHTLALPIAYRNQAHILYQRSRL